MRHVLLAVVAVLWATSAVAHGPDKGPNGGAQVDAGNHHVELVAKETALAVYLYDRNDKRLTRKARRLSAYSLSTANRSGSN
jgi:hypothetical protein